MGDGLPQLDRALDETLRLYPPAWIGPRRAVRTFDVRRRHRARGRARELLLLRPRTGCPTSGEDPEAFLPERFAPEGAPRCPKGAYVPFGGGSRQCIGMRFGQLEIKAIAARILREHRLELAPGPPAADPPDADARAPRAGCRCACARLSRG